MLDRREFLKLTGLLALQAALPLKAATDIIIVDVLVDDAVLRKSLTLGKHSYDQGLAIEVSVDMQTAYSAVTLLDSKGGVWATTDMKTWRCGDLSFNSVTRHGRDELL